MGQTFARFIAAASAVAVSGCFFHVTNRPPDLVEALSIPVLPTTAPSAKETDLASGRAAESRERRILRSVRELLQHDFATPSSLADTQAVTEQLQLLSRTRESPENLKLEVVARLLRADDEVGDPNPHLPLNNRPYFWNLIQAIRAYQFKLRVHADNLANAQTHGYKRRVVTLESGARETPDPLALQQAESGGQRKQLQEILQLFDASDPGGTFDRETHSFFARSDSPPAQLDLPRLLLAEQGVRIVGIESDMSQGAMSPTSDSLNVAVEGRGFFVVHLPDGRQGFTRRGDVSLDRHGTLCCLIDGKRLSLEPPIQIPLSVELISVDGDGKVMFREPNAKQMQTAGSIVLVTFPHPEALERVATCLYVESDASGPPIIHHAGGKEAGTVVGATLEQSNVEPLEEILEALKALYQLRSLRRLAHLD